MQAEKEHSQEPGGVQVVCRDGALQQLPAKHHQRHPAPMGEQEEGSRVRGELSPRFPLSRE